MHTENSKSAVFVRLPHEKNIEIHKGHLQKCVVSDWLIEKHPQFIFTNGLNPQELFTVSGEVSLIEWGDSHTQRLYNEVEEFLNGFTDHKNGCSTQAETFDDFENQINSVKSAINDRILEKVVVARIIQKSIIEAPGTGDLLVDWYLKLCEKYLDCLVYLFLDNNFGIWIGASPELLLSRNSFGESQTVSLAGTLFQETEEWSIKEKLEQSTTSQHIMEVLDELRIKSEISGLQEHKNGDLRHLVSKYSFFSDSNQLLQLLQKLNPTPAVIGYPQKTALKWVKSNLKLDRELYSGAVGLVSLDKTVLHVNLRCAKIYLHDRVDFFAGCGINSMSNPKREWEETSLKAEVIGQFIPSRLLKRE